MEPLRTVEYAVRFAAALSAWWLLLAVPVVALLGVAIYRRQARTIAWGNAWGLTLLRAVILVAVVVLAFRPSLIRRETATYPGRLLLVLDDSASMGIRDPALPEDEALAIARQTADRLAGRETPLADLRNDVLALESTLIRFEQFSRGTDRALDVFWREAERVQAQVNERLGAVAQRASDLANGADATNKVDEVAGRCRDLQESLKPLFSGNQPPPGEFVLKMRASLSELASLLGGAQKAADRTAIGAGDKALTDAVEAVRSAPRLDLAYAWLRRHRDALIGALDGVSLWMLPLSQKEPTSFSKIAVDTPVVSTIETDISGVLLRLLEEDNPFPLAGILLFSDGRNLGNTPLDVVTRAATLRSVPIYSAGVGGATEPPDLAVRQVYYPPFAVSGKPVGLRTHLKTVMTKPGKAELELLHAGKTALTNETLEIDEHQTMQRHLAWTPEAEGLQRLTVQLGSLEGEVVPQENNRMDLTVLVRPEPVRVLFLDWKPRWQSRFVLNILSRLDYLDVNSIIALAQPGGLLKRGVGKGFWPEDAGALALYDLVIVGDLPSALLTPEEWNRLSDYVNNGGSLAFLGNGQRDPIPPAVQGLLPTQPRTAETPSPSDTATLQLTPAGRHHPVTRSLQSVLENAESVVENRRMNDTIGLLQTSDGRMLISARFIGKGKTLFVDTDRLWRRLNAAALDAHASLVAGLADWAIEARRPMADLPQPDLFRYTSRESVQIWTEANGMTNVVVELRSGERLLEALAVPTHTGATWAAAVFKTVPADDWTIMRRGGGALPEPLRVVGRSRELHDLARNEAYLRTLAADAGGAYAEFTDAGRLLNDIQPRSRVERQERVWRLWDSGWVLALLVVMLTIEWVWRKLAGLV
jgi:hypothetical protein